MEIKVLDVPLDENLQNLSQFLWQQKVTHRIIRLGDRQLLLVGKPEDADYVWQSYQRWQQGELHLQEEKETAVDASPKRKITTPVTFLAVVLSVLGFLLVRVDSNFELVRQLTFFPFDITVSGNIHFRPLAGEYWRLLTPAFLHFSLLHIVFNMLWLWDLGRRVELQHGRWHLLLLMTLIAVLSNLCQAWYGGGAIFGGMSGVIYGLLGYGWVWGACYPQRSLGIPLVVINFMLAWLVLCMLGFAELLGAGAIANAAHLGGLVSGMLLGGVTALVVYLRLRWS